MSEIILKVENFKKEFLLSKDRKIEAVNGIV